MKTKVVAITGASARIGRATAITFARRGWRVALLARGFQPEVASGRIHYAALHPRRDTMPGDHGAHSRFDRQAAETSGRLWGNRGGWLLAGVAVALLSLLGRRRIGPPH